MNEGIGSPGDSFSSGSTLWGKLLCLHAALHNFSVGFVEGISKDSPQSSGDGSYISGATREAPFHHEGRGQKEMNKTLKSYSSPAVPYLFPCDILAPLSKQTTQLLYDICFIFE